MSDTPLPVGRVEKKEKQGESIIIYRVIIANNGAYRVMQLCNYVSFEFLSFPFLNVPGIIVLLYTYVKRIPGYTYDIIHCFVLRTHIYFEVLYIRRQ